MGCVGPGGGVCVCECVRGSAALAYARARRSTGEFCFFAMGVHYQFSSRRLEKLVPAVFFTPAARRARRPGRPASSPCRSQPSSRLSSGASLSFRPPFRTPPRSGPTTARARATKPDSRCVWHVKKASHDKNTAPLHTADGSTPRPVLPALQRGAELLTHQACLCTHRRVRWSRC